MDLLTQTQFAELCGVAQTTISGAIARRQVVPRKDGLINPEVKQNQAYRAKCRTQDARMAAIDKGRNLTHEDRAASIELKRAQTARHKLRLEVDKGRLVPLEIVLRGAAVLAAEIRNRIQDLPKRIVPRIVAMLGAGADEGEVRHLVEKELDDALEAIKKVKLV